MVFNLLYLFILIPIVFGQEIGQFPTKIFRPTEHHGSAKTYCSVQSINGIMYFGNQEGVLEYDGNRWRSISINGERSVRSLTLGNDSLIYVGAYNEFGYLKENSEQVLTYHSLSEQIKHLPFEDIWQVEQTSHGIFFRSKTYLFLWDGTTVHSFSKGLPDNHHNRFTNLTQMNKSILVYSVYYGIEKLENGQFNKAPFADVFKHQVIQGFFPHEKNRATIVTYKGNYYTYSFDKLIKHPSDHIKEYIKKNRISSVSKLSENRIAVATHNGGVLITTRDGQIIETIDEDVGLSKDPIIHVSEDKTGNLWLTTPIGITYVHYKSHMSIFSEERGLRGIIHDISRYQNQLYVATQKGVFRYNPSAHRFNQTNLAKSSANDLYQSRNGNLIYTTNQGTYLYNGKEVLKGFPYSSGSIEESKQHPNQFYITRPFDRVIIRQLFPGENQKQNTIYHYSDYRVKKIFSLENGKVLFLTENNLFFYLNESELDHPKALIPNQTLTEFAQKKRFSLFSTNNQIFIHADNQIYRFSLQKETFVSDPRFAELISPEFNIRSFHLRSNELWAIIRTHTGERYAQKALLHEKKYRWDTLTNLNLKRIPATKIHLEKQLVWLINHNKLYKLSLDDVHTKENPFPITVRSVYMDTDSLLMYSNKTQKNIYLTLPPNTKQLSIEYTQPSFHTSNSYQITQMVNGQEERYQTHENTVQLHALNYGQHILTISSPQENVQSATVHIFVENVWYLSWWALLLEALLVLLLIYSIVQIYSAQLVKRNLKLQQLVDEQTKDLHEKAERLKALDQAKSNFFVNISHEFKTPLSLIIGPINELLCTAEGHSKYLLNLIKDQSSHLLENINQLLDLTKMQEKSLEIERTHQDLIPFLKHIINAFQTLASEKQLTIMFNPHQVSYYATFDVYKLHKIIQNLLSNALKFTPEGGTIELITDESAESVLIKLRDTGIGISPEKQSLIFERFYQVKNDLTRAYEGTGIGMSVVKEFAEAHGGQVRIESKPGAGTTIHLAFPKATFLESMDTMMSQENYFPPAPEPIASKTLPETKTLKKETLPELLIVEDHVDLRQYLKKALSPHYRVHTAYNGAIGLDKACSILPELILSDLMMPEKSGLELLEDIKSNTLTNHIPFILLTAKSEIEDRLVGLRYGADDYIAKPFETEEILLRIQNVLTTRANLRTKLTEKVLSNTLEEPLSPEEQFLKSVEELVLHSLSDINFSIENITNELHMSRSALHRKFRSVSELSPNAFIRSIRLREAKKLISLRQFTISQISDKCGFRNVSYFTSSFKKEFQLTPKEFERSIEST